MLKRISLFIVALVMLLALAYAGTVPNWPDSVVDGTEISIEALNEIDDAIEDNDSRITAIESIVGLVECDGTDCAAADGGDTMLGNPMTTADDIIKGGTDGEPERVAAQANSILGYDENSVLAPYDSFAFDDSGYQFVDDEDVTRQVRFILDDVPPSNMIDINIPGRTDGGVMGLAGVDTGLLTANTTLTAAQCQDHVWFVTGAYTVTLPAIADYLHCKFYTIGANAVSISPNASDKIYLDGTALDDGDKITNASTSGDNAEVFYYSSAGWYAGTNGWSDGGAVATSCTSLYDMSALTSDDNAWISRTDETAFHGFVWTPDDNALVCSIDVYVYGVAGTLTSSHDYYARIYEVNQTTHVVTGTVGTSNVVPGEDIVSGTWVSANAGTFDFATPASLTADTKYVIAFFLDRDGNQSDAPEVDATNRWSAGIDNENDGDSSGDHQDGRVAYSYNDISGSIAPDEDLEDDFEVIIYTVQ